MKRKTDWKEIIDVHLWAARVWWKIDPRLFISTGLVETLNVLTPYITVWFSAQIINELAGSRTPEKLWKWVILTVCVTAGLKLLSEALYHWMKAVHGLEWDYEDKLLADKMMDMDYAAVEAPETNDLRFSIINWLFQIQPSIDPVLIFREPSRILRCVLYVGSML